MILGVSLHNPTQILSLRSFKNTPCLRAVDPGTEGKYRNKVLTETYLKSDIIRPFLTLELYKSKIIVHDLMARV